MHVGSEPLVGGLGLEHAGVEQKPGGYISVDELQNTSAAGVYALGEPAGQPASPPARCCVPTDHRSRRSDSSSSSSSQYAIRGGG